MARSFPARLHVLLAREAPVAVVLRRGPSNSVCSILWDRKKDTFNLGQWLRGRIYERRCDISPDGQYFIYFAMNGRWSSRTKGSWTAVSRVPWLKAIVLLSKGDCWQGGGLFTSDRRYWVNGGCCHEVVEESREVKPDEKFAPSTAYGAECPGVYYLRLQRDGWSGPRIEGPKLDRIAVFEKALPHGWVLRKFAHEQIGPPQGKGCYWDSHELEHADSGEAISSPAWEWADWDGSRLLWAENGRLFSAGIRKRNGLGEPSLLHDFNEMKFEPIAAPY